MTNIELLQTADRQKGDTDFTKLRTEYILCSEELSGLSASYEELDALLTRGRIPEGLSDEQACAVMGHGIAFDAMLQLASTQTPVSQELLMQFHGMLLGASAGNSEYRRTPLEDSHAAAPEDIDHLMSHFIDQITSSAYLHPIEYAAMCHKRLLDIQPWSEDNDKVARLLMSYILVRNGFPPVCIGKDQKEAYDSALLALQSQYDMDPFIKLLAENVLRLKTRS